MVLVSHLWWKSFAPFLWENIYVDADPQQDDRQIIFRNGLAARSLTLSVYDSLDSKGVVAYVSDRCKNVTQLHLKLLSPNLIRMKKSTQEKDLYQCIAREHHETTLLDGLLSKLSHVTELTLSIAHQDVQPEVLYSIANLQRLRKLTLYGGLKAPGFIMKTNRRCDWNLIMQIAKECPSLESLSVGWECRPLMSPDQKHECHRKTLVRTLAMCQKMAQDNPFAPSKQVPNLKWLHLLHMDVFDSDLDIVYRYCPNLREVTFDSVGMSFKVFANNLKMLAVLCPLLRSLTMPEPDNTDLGSFEASSKEAESLLDGSLSNLNSVRLSAGYLRCYSLLVYQDGGLPKSLFLTALNLYQRIHCHSITVLHVTQLDHYDMLFSILTTVSGLTHLTLSGDLMGCEANSYDVVESYHKNDRDPDLCLPSFASQDTLKLLSVRHLDMLSLKFHQLFFARVQRMKRLERLEVSFKQIQDARLEETWLDPDGDVIFSKHTDGLIYPEKALNPETFSTIRERNYKLFGVCYVHHGVLQYGPEGENYRSWRFTPFLNDNEQDQDSHPEEGELNTVSSSLSAARSQHKLAAIAFATERTFSLFPAVKYLYVHDGHPTRLSRERGHYISEHMASALARMMPELKVMSYDRNLGMGLKRVKKTFSNVIFDCVIP
ncbi:hypothetical protein BGX28_009076 [Mortierella sp. GBA30]|nr:hypothetical protein BGX28_009076 [Mortierella sp. GBA30]